MKSFLILLTICALFLIAGNIELTNKPYTKIIYIKSIGFHYYKSTTLDPPLNEYSIVCPDGKPLTYTAYAQYDGIEEDDLCSQ